VGSGARSGWLALSVGAGFLFMGAELSFMGGGARLCAYTFMGGGLLLVGGGLSFVGAVVPCCVLCGHC
jgi:hypothetical protein